MYKSKMKGFTLVEIIVSIAILAIVGLSIMNAFITSHRGNRTSKVIDYANIEATNAMENLKANPADFLKKMKCKSVQNFDKENKLITDKISLDDLKLKQTIKKFKKFQYYDYQWKKVATEDEASYILEMDVKNEQSYEGYKNVIPPIQDIVKDGDLSLNKNVKQYLLLIYDKPERDLSMKGYPEYRLIMYHDYTIDSFLNNYIHGTGVGSLEYKYLNHPTEPYSIDDFNNKIKNGGRAKLFYYAGNMENKQQVRNKNLAQGSAILHFDVNDFDFSNPNVKYRIDVINDTLIDLDIYLIGSDSEKIRNGVIVNVNNGVAKTTIFENSRRYQGMYTADIKVYSKENKGKNICKLSLMDYKPE